MCLISVAQGRLVIVRTLKISEIELNIYITCWLDPKAKNNSTEKKFEYLANTILHLSRIATKRTKLTIFTNNKVVEFEPLMRPLSYNKNSEFHVREVPKEELIDIPTKIYVPWLLTWAHKGKMKEDIYKGHEKSMYLYLEDDAIFTSENLAYFLEYLPKLNHFGLIPGYLRAEWSKSRGCWINPDTFFENSIKKLSKIQITNEIFFQRENPYSASILLTQELASEYVRSESFEQQKAWNKHKYIFDIGSTAALGLIAENVPHGYLNRVATPHDPVNYYPHPSCILRHQGDKYASDVWQSHFELFSSYPERRLYSHRNLIHKILRLTKKDRLSILKKKIYTIKKGYF